MARETASVETRRVSKAFGGRRANENVDFRAHSGEIHAVLGENGAGKSTLVSMLSGVYRPDSGEILVRGEAVQFRSPRDALRAGIGVVYQEFRLVENLTVLENVLLGSGERPSASVRRRVADVARSAGFELPLSARVSSLPIAQRQQVEIVKLLFRDLHVLIFDEPTAVLGEAQVGELFAALSALRAQGKTIILITHRLREVRMLADRLTILRDGTVRVLDSPVDAFTDQELAEQMVGADTEAAPVRLETRPGDAVLRLADVHVRAASGAGLRGVDLEVREGEIVGVAGVRGNGQREVAEVAAGLITPDVGTVERRLGPVGFIPEDRLGMGLSRRMTVAENLALRCYATAPIGRPWHLSRTALHGWAAAHIDAYAIPSAPDALVTRLSGGGLQRVVIARELDRNAPLIVAAQPTRGLDIRSAEFVRRRLLDAAGRGAAVLLVSEDLDELIAVSSRILVFYEGAVVAAVARTAFDRRRLGAMMLGADAA